MGSKKTIPYKGNYWWGDAENVTSVIEEEIKNILGSTRVYSIKITGTDFNDGRENHKISITVNSNNIEIEKEA